LICLTRFGASYRRDNTSLRIKNKQPRTGVLHLVLGSWFSAAEPIPTENLNPRNYVLGTAVIGALVERLFGSWRWLALYFSTGEITDACWNSTADTQS
jgi:hypothetical protein